MKSYFAARVYERVTMKIFYGEERGPLVDDQEGDRDKSMFLIIFSLVNLVRKIVNILLKLV